MPCLVSEQAIHNQGNKLVVAKPIPESTPDGTQLVERGPTGRERGAPLHEVLHHKCCPILLADILGRCLSDEVTSRLIFLIVRARGGWRPKQMPEHRTVDVIRKIFADIRNIGAGSPIQQTIPHLARILYLHFQLSVPRCSLRLEAADPYLVGAEQRRLAPPVRCVNLCPLVKEQGNHGLAAKVDGTYQRNPVTVITPGRVSSAVDQQLRGAHAIAGDGAVQGQNRLVLVAWPAACTMVQEVSDCSRVAERHRGMEGRLGGGFVLPPIAPWRRPGSKVNKTRREDGKVHVACIVIHKIIYVVAIPHCQLHCRRLASLGGPSQDPHASFGASLVELICADDIASLAGPHQC